MATFTKIVNGEVIELSEEEIQELVDSWNDNDANMRKIQYQHERRSLYPSFGDQLDAIWKALSAGNLVHLDKDTEICYNNITNIKLLHPKP